MARADSEFAGTGRLLLPTIVPAHPVGTIMAVADRAGDILATRWG